jgi:isopentenyl-diphosphate delta-isomerase
MCVNQKVFTFAEIFIVMEKVILVDEKDQAIGTMEKMEAHLKGLMHRAFSIFIFNTNGELMLQQRALSKYHSPGQWTNTCCSHPREGETTLKAAHRRLVEEMGFDTPVEEKFSFTYYSDEVGEGLIEHEFDHVFFGKYEEKPNINKEEVNDWKFMAMEDIKQDIKQNPQKYTVWFRIAFDEVMNHLQQQKSK